MSILVVDTVIHDVTHIALFSWSICPCKKKWKICPNSPRVPYTFFSVFNNKVNCYFLLMRINWIMCCYKC